MPEAAAWAPGESPSEANDRIREAWPAMIAERVAERVRFSDEWTISLRPGIRPLIRKVALAAGMKSTDWTRKAIEDALRAAGADPAAIAPRDAGSLYNLIEGQRHWALVRDGGVIAMHRSADKPQDEQGGTWLPIEYRDSEPFDPALHWRGNPVLVVEADKVTRTYPIIDKSEGG